MKVGIAVLDDEQKQEIISKTTNSGIVFQWANSTREILQLSDADFWIDCTYSIANTHYFEKPTLVHAPDFTLASINIGTNVGRICAWSTFLSREMWEVSAAAGSDTSWIEKLMCALGWKYFLVKDELGLIAPRILSTIINEAYHTLQAGVSTHEEIDIAMRLGTNYPFGPLEWGKKIGLKQVRNLLEVLAKSNYLYTPAFSE